MRFRSVRRGILSFLLFFVGAVVLLAGPASASAQGYRAGEIVRENFSFVNRYRWTNDHGQVFTPNDTSFQLSDFDGKIVFFAFFDVW